MKSETERLWTYVDGSCSPQERDAISLLIASNEACRQEYEAILALNAELADLELDEPPMAFTYNVMETIRAEQASVPLKAHIDQRIIRGIAAFFVISIVALVILAVANMKWTLNAAPLFTLPSFDFKMPDINLAAYFNKSVIQGFLYVDLVGGMFLLDTYLRRRKVIKSA